MTSPARSAAADAVLGARAEELARPHDEHQGEDAIDLLVVSVGGRPVAMPLRSVAEVRSPSPVAQVPATDAVLLGLVGGRGDALAVAPLAALLALPTSVPLHEQWVAVLHHPTAPLGLLADGVQEVVRVTEHDMTPAAGAGGLVIAILPDGALLLDPEALLRDPRVSLHRDDHAEEPQWHER